MRLVQYISICELTMWYKHERVVNVRQNDGLTCLRTGKIVSICDVNVIHSTAIKYLLRQRLWGSWCWCHREQEVTRGCSLAPRSDAFLACRDEALEYSFIEDKALKNFMPHYFTRDLIWPKHFPNKLRLLHSSLCERQYKGATMSCKIFQESPQKHAGISSKQSCDCRYAPHYYDLIKQIKAASPISTWKTTQRQQWAEKSCTNLLKKCRNLL